jgi:hypothetical protein
MFFPDRAVSCETRSEAAKISVAAADLVFYKAGTPYGVIRVNEVYLAREHIVGRRYA